MVSSPRPVAVAITGGSAAGKTTFARKLTEYLSEFSCLILHQDSYFRDWSEYPEEIREQVRTSNRPDAVRWDVLLKHLEQLLASQPIQMPPPGTRAAVRDTSTTTLGPCEVILVEGHLVLWNESLRDMMDFKLFIEADPHERVLRRLLREVGKEWDLERAVAWYRRDVIPNFPIYTESCKRYADLIIPWMEPNEVALRTVAAGIRAEMANRRSP